MGRPKTEADTVTNLKVGGAGLDEDISIWKGDINAATKVREIEKTDYDATNKDRSRERTRMIRMIEAESSLWQLFHPTRRMEPRRK